MSRLDQVNSLLHQELAKSLHRHFDLDGILVTISDVRCAPDLNEAKIFVSVLPEKLAGTALKKLRHISGALAREIRPRVKFRRVPSFIWLFDDRPSRASQIDELIHELHDEK